MTLRAQKPLAPAYPKFLITLGDHLRKRRLDLKLFQKDIAQQLGVDEASVHNWESGHATPSLHLIPKILKFLGYFPFEIPTGDLREKIKAYRRILGLSQKALAKRLKIDPTTLARWQKGKGRPKKELLNSISDLVGSVKQNRII